MSDEVVCLGTNLPLQFLLPLQVGPGILIPQLEESYLLSWGLLGYPATPTDASPLLSMLRSLQN